jgi:hypothetical protein
MTIKTTEHQATKKKVEIDHPGMMGDGTEEQNLGQRGDPAARIKKEDVDAAFGDRHQQPSTETTHEERQTDNDNNKP